LLGDRNKDYVAPGATDPSGWIFEADFESEKVTIDPAATCPLVEGSGT
jgi:hypothetical protein